MAERRHATLAIIGLPNSGKSTLLNALLGQKLAATSQVPQTTRTRVLGVVDRGDVQLAFLDTPGIHKADSPLNKRLMNAVRAALDQRDLLLFVADAAHGFEEQDRRALDLLRKAATPAVLVLNKIDLLREKGLLLPLIESYKAVYEFVECVPVSAVKGDGLDALRGVILDRLPEGPAYFPDDYVTDQPERFLAAELVREKVVLATRKEVPHSVSVTVDRWEEAPNITRIYATIRVEREGQKPIVIGANGSMLKKIGTLARKEMEKLFSVRIYLDLHVRVQPGWRSKPAFLDALDWRTMAGEDDT